MAPKAKNSHLAFLMALSTALVVESSQDHQYPRHLTLGQSVRPSPSRVALGAFVAGFDEEISNTSHSVGFRFSPLFAAKVNTLLICSYRVARELLIVCNLSAWMKLSACMSPTEGPKHPLCRDLMRGPIISRKKTRDRTDLWKTPCSKSEW